MEMREPVRLRRRLYAWRLVSLVLLVLLGLIAWRLLVPGSTTPHPDGRTSIQLAPDDRNLVLTEMRQFLTSVQGITQALTEEDMTKVAASARAVGMAAAQAVPPTLMAALPLEFKTMGRGVHQAFDQLALDAESLGDPRHSQQQLAGILSSCVACHAAYRLDEK